MPPTAEALRARDFLARYAGLRPGHSSPLWQELYKELAQVIARGDFRLLIALYELLESEGGDTLAVARQTAWRGLALVRDPEAVREFLERAARPPRGELLRYTNPRAPRGLPARTFGALLAYGQGDDMLEEALEWFGRDPSLTDVLACWVQERLLRGSDIGGSPLARELWRALGEAGHELAALPLELVDIEAGLLGPAPRPLDTLGNWFYFTGPGYYDRLAPRGAGGARPGPAAREVALDEPARLALAAVAADPAVESCSYEARVFALDPAPEAAPDLAALGLECLEGPGEGGLREAAVSAREVMAQLLSTATFGGAYTPARSAAYGRLLAWRSLAALSGAPAGAALPEVSAAAGRCAWLGFLADTPWFYRVCSEGGLACLRPDRRSLAVLAWSDTD